MSEPPSTAPSGNQFTLRGIFILITAVSVILGLLALAIREPYQWLGTISIVVFCLMVIGLLELCRKLFPPKPRFPKDLPPLPVNPLQTMHFGEGESPFAQQPASGASPFRPPPTDSKLDSYSPNGGY
jgi:hypothetical protein